MDSLSALVGVTAQANVVIREAGVQKQFKIGINSGGKKWKFRIQDLFCIFGLALVGVWDFLFFPLLSTLPLTVAAFIGIRRRNTFFSAQ